MGRGVAVGAPSFHGLVLGILVDLVDSGYEVKSNPASGPGRLDVTIVPGDSTRDACVLEFKVVGEKGARALEGGCGEALAQIEDRSCDDAIISRGIGWARIRHFGTVLAGRRVLVRRGA